MLNPAANGESVHVLSNYVEEYLELVESLPLDLQRCVSLMREIDAKYQGWCHRILTSFYCSPVCLSHVLMLSTKTLKLTNIT